MSTHRTETSERKERGDETDATSRAKRVASTVTRQGRNGTAAVLTGGALLVRAVRAPRSKRKAAVQGLVGAALLGLGLRQRRSGGGTPTGGDGTAERDDEGKEVSDEAHAARERDDVLHQSEANPRGVSGEPETETATDPDEGAIQFTDEQDDEPQSQPHIDEEDPMDPRYDDVDDEAAEIDLSEASLADEASEAVGPDPEQAMPAQTEDTEPESSPSEDASHMQADAADETDAADDAGADDEGSDTAEGDGVTTDTDVGDDSAFAGERSDENEDEATGDSEDREDEDEDTA